MLLTRNWTQRKLVALSAALAVSLCAALYAQAPNPHGANASKYNVAVVDVSYIFKNHARFKATMEAMKAEMQKTETEFKADRERIAGLEQQRGTFAPGSAEYKKHDEEVARQMAEVQLKYGKIRKDFLEREAKVYYQTYLEVVDAITYYAKRQSIGLVLRFNGDPVDTNKRDDVLREINKPIVVQDQIDITGDILVLINRDNQNVTPTPPGAPGVTGPPGPTQGGSNARQGYQSQLPPK
jgi:Skp family chaperone for outer membrane proteins